MSSQSPAQFRMPNVEPPISEATFPHGSSSEAQKGPYSPSSSIRKLERHAVEALSMERRGVAASLGGISKIESPDGNGHSEMGGKKLTSVG